MELWSKGVRAPTSSPTLVAFASLFKRADDRLPPPPPKPCAGCGGGSVTPQTKAKGGADRNRGGAEKLRAYWVRGEGAAKIGWGTPGDFARCVALVSKYMPGRAEGYCNLRHHDALGSWPGDHKGFTPVMQYKANGANPLPDAVMVALYAPHDVAATHAMGDPADMHLTLAYLGKVGEVPDPTALHEVVADLAASTDPIHGEVSGVGRFSGPKGEGDPVYLSVDAPDLAAFRQKLVDALTAAGLPVRADHGFTPHITLDYVGHDKPTPIGRIDPTPAEFGLLSMAYGPDVWDYPMGATE